MLHANASLPLKVKIPSFFPVSETVGKIARIYKVRAVYLCRVGGGVKPATQHGARCHPYEKIPLFFLNG